MRTLASNKLNKLNIGLSSWARKINALTSLYQWVWIQMFRRKGTKLKSKSNYGVTLIKNFILHPL